MLEIFESLSVGGEEGEGERGEGGVIFEVLMENGR